MSSISPTHITRLFPDWFITFGGTTYYDPGLPQVRDHVTRVVEDLVERYDLDAIHFDDYFYPYPIAGRMFPDDMSYAKYGNGMERGDWRRSNVDSIIKQLSAAIKKINPRVKFGISPFGVWRNQSKDERGSPSKAGLTNYDDLYADILLWHSYVGFNMLLNWWSQHTFGRQLFIGHGIYRTYETKSYAWKKADEIPKQIRAVRANDEALGSIFFSSNTFKGNPMGWNDTLRNNYYKYPALVPPMRWIDSIPPIKPIIEGLSKNEVRVYYRGAEPIKAFAVYTVPSGTYSSLQTATLIDVITADKTADINITTLKTSPGDKIFLASVDRNNNVSEWVQVKPEELAKATLNAEAVHGSHYNAP